MERSVKSYLFQVLWILGTVSEIRALYESMYVNRAAPIDSAKHGKKHYPVGLGK